ncbi:purine-nucleoside phosphorylase [Vampirovibrio sp.]|uniref:purine-nucleoside phosphorylase n=1 Tax=Vampirovibrio sp. TaxID=2717857 RepID=UPI003594283F
MTFQEQLAQAVAFIQNQSPYPQLKGLVVLGSGLGAFAETLQNPHYIEYKDIPYFQQSSVQGHAGRLVLGEAAPGFAIACMQGRFHYYEGHAMDTVVFPVRVLKQLGIEFMMVTNAAGGIHPDFQPGTLMLIEDHLNLMGDNPLKGPNYDMLGPRFPDMSEAYNQEMRTLAKQVASEQNIELASGVYAGLSGPTYETPAEVRMLRGLGADAVGMSTVPEVIAANHMGLNVMGISCITNQAAGLSLQKLSHQEVMDTAEQSRQRFMDLLQGVLTRLAAKSIALPQGGV